MPFLVATLWTLLRLPSPTGFLMYGDWGHDLAGGNQIVHGEHPFIDYKSVYGPLVFYANAAAQRLAGDRPIGAVALAALGHGAAYAALFILLERASRRRALAAAVLVLGLVLQPQMYKYYMVLGPALTLLAAWRHIDRGDRTSLWLLAAAVALSGLFRAEYGAYAALAGGLAVAGREAPPRARLRRTLAFAAAVVACASPWLLWAGWRSALWRYLDQTLRGGTRLADGMGASLPRFASTPPLATVENGIVVSFALFVVLPSLSLAVLFRNRGALREGEALRISCVALLGQLTLLQAFYRPDFLHLQQALPACLVLVAWLGGRLLDGLGSIDDASARERAAGGLLALGALACVPVLVALHESPQPSLDLRGWSRNLRDYCGTREELVEAVERTHPDFWLAKTIRYVRTHSLPRERVLFIPHPLHNLYYVCDRLLAGGQLLLMPGFFTTPEDQDEMVERLRTQEVALVVNIPDFQYERRESGRVQSFAPTVWEHVRRSFPEAEPLGRASVRRRGAATGRAGR